MQEVYSRVSINLRGKIMDKRIIRTVSKIKQNFIALLHEEDFSKITVKMICEKSKIERKTFYLHFKDKYQLLDVVIEDRIDAFRNQIRLMPNATPADFYKEALDFYDRHNDIFKKIYNDRGSVQVRKKIQLYMLHRFEERYGKDNDPTFMNFAAAGISGVFEAYVNGELKEDKQKIAQDIAELISIVKEHLDRNNKKND